MNGHRLLATVADDYGIGPATSAAILELAQAGRVTGTVLLVNSPFAEEAVRAWRRAAPPADIGWHPNLTLDRPVLPPQRVPSLVDENGFFYPLGRFLRRAVLGQLRSDEVEAEWHAQLERYHDLLGQPPRLVNAHQHVHLFGPVGPVLMGLLKPLRPRPVVRRVREPWRLLARVPGARFKRLVLSHFGRRDARRLDEAGLPGNDGFAGIAGPSAVRSPDYFARWLRHVPGQRVEFMCHPGHHDPTLIGRDCTAHDGLLQRRVDEYEQMRRPDFLDACRDAGFTLVPPSRLAVSDPRGGAHAA